MEQKIGLYVPPPEGNGSLTSSKVKTFISRPCFDMAEIQELVAPYGGIDEGVIRDFVSNPDNNEEIIKMLSRTFVPTPFQKGALLSQVGAERAEELGLDVPIDGNADFRINVFSPKWMLCSDSEARLTNSLRHTTVAAVGSGLLVKFEGRLTALCYETFTTESSTFYRGNWYSPVSSHLREGLVEAHDAGIMRPEIRDGEWLLVRGSDSRYKRLIGDANDAAQNMPERLPRIVNGQDKRFIRIGTEESEANDSDNLATF